MKAEPLPESGPRSTGAPSGVVLTRPPSRPPRPLTEGEASEDVAYHLHRANELLQSGHTELARDELHQALATTPADPKSQDLLASLYFRLGLYPRAIELYEALLRDFPEELTLGTNLSVCYLKTGQFARARDILERLVGARPSTKLWGYFGLALERLGEYQRARTAYNESGHPQLASRCEQRTKPPAPAPSEPGDTEVRKVAEHAFVELSMERVDFELAEDRHETAEGGWRTREPGRETLRAAPREDLLKVLGEVVRGEPRVTFAETPPPLVAQPQTAQVPAAAAVSSAVLRMTVEPDAPLRGALYAIAAWSGALEFARLRHDRCIVHGTGALWITRVSPHLRNVEVPRGTSMREDLVVFGPEGAEAPLTVADREPIAYRTLPARATLLLDTPEPLTPVAMHEGDELMVRREQLAGFSAELLVTDVPYTEAPLSQRGLLRVRCTGSGDGTLYLLGR